MKGLCIWGLLILSVGAVSSEAGLFTVDAKAHSAFVTLSKTETGPGEGLNTGIYLKAGQHFTVSVDPKDLWSGGKLPRWSNADGLIGDLYATGTDESGQPAGTLIGQYPGKQLERNGLTAPYGALVGEISGTYFLLGTSFSGPAPSSGTLRLFYWDSNNADNSEHVVANVHTPEASTYALFGLGAVGLMAWRRRKKAE